VERSWILNKPNENIRKKIKVCNLTKNKKRTLTAVLTAALIKL